MTNKFSLFLKRFHQKKSKFRDPVCGMTANEAITSQYQGKAYYFCSTHCKEQFDQDPVVYV